MGTDLALANRSLTRLKALPSGVSTSGDQYGDDTHRDEEDEPYTEEEARGRFPFYPSWGWGGGWGLVPFGGSREEETRYDEEPYEDADGSPYDEDDSGSLWDEGLITLLIVGGVALFLFPEPVTSGVGILLLSIGVIAWLVDWAL